jgi:NADPH:quinone reductase-like Zn-dependent oxidoreductase
VLKGGSWRSVDIVLKAMAIIDLSHLQSRLNKYSSYSRHAAKELMHMNKSIDKTSALTLPLGYMTAPARL